MKFQGKKLAAVHKYRVLGCLALRTDGYDKTLGLHLHPPWGQEGCLWSCFPGHLLPAPSEATGRCLALREGRQRHSEFRPLKRSIWSPVLAVPSQCERPLESPEDLIGFPYHWNRWCDSHVFDITVPGCDALPH